MVVVDPRTMTVNACSRSKPAQGPGDASGGRPGTDLASDAWLAYVADRLDRRGVRFGIDRRPGQGAFTAEAASLEEAAEIAGLTGDQIRRSAGSRFARGEGHAATTAAPCSPSEKA